MNTCALKMRKITAIFQETMLAKVELALGEAGVGGFTVTSVKGCGEYKNYYTQDLTSCHARIEIFIIEERAEDVVLSIMAAAHIGLEGDGIVAISPVESLYRIRTLSKLTS
ncbi:MAG: P-II family nitrogen regulator [Mariprofundaceae bacterium]|nr:P-II family nitrogen regulator [Mariprofundaceae bacterium]